MSDCTYFEALLHEDNGDDDGNNDDDGDGDLEKAVERMKEVWRPCFLVPEIASRPDMEVEGDKRLDKLESFLDRLHSKGKQH